MTTTQPIPTTCNGIPLEPLRQTAAAIGAQPSLGLVTFRSSSRWIEAHRVSTSIGRFQAAGAEHTRLAPHYVGTDLPEAMHGSDQGATPLELAFSALGACVATTLVAHAAARELTLASLEVDVAGDLDLSVFLGLVDLPSTGRRVELQIAIESEHDREVLQRFVDETLPLSAVYDLFMRGAEVGTALEVRAG